MLKTCRHRWMNMAFAMIPINELMMMGWLAEWFLTLLVNNLLKCFSEVVDWVLDLEVHHPKKAAFFVGCRHFNNLNNIILKR
jgi:hypothetical protein